MKPAPGMAFLVLILADTGLGALRLLDQRAERAECNRPAGLQPADLVPFSHRMVAGLPDPARRCRDPVWTGPPSLTGPRA
jgi:hypothetical protein